MADKNSVRWPAATPMIDRGGARIRFYSRKNVGRPGTQLRRSMFVQGKKWCRDCAAWLPLESVGKNGLCREHANADYRSRYAAPGRFRERRKDHAVRRRRGVDRLPAAAAADLAELFDHRCAYCDYSIECWDHVEPVSKGGTTVQGNIVPACIRCNSAKKNLDIFTWFDRAPMVKPFTVEYLATIGVIDLPEVAR